MKRKKAWFKSPIHIMAPLLVASVMIMGTVAYFTDVEAVVNTIRFGQISIETNEEVSGLTKSNIGVTAQRNADCFTLNIFYLKTSIDVSFMSLLEILFRVIPLLIREQSQFNLFGSKGIV